MAPARSRRTAARLNRAFRPLCEWLDPTEAGLRDVTLPTTDVRREAPAGYGPLPNLGPASRREVVDAQGVVIWPQFEFGAGTVGGVVVVGEYGVLFSRALVAAAATVIGHGDEVIPARLQSHLRALPVAVSEVVARHTFFRGIEPTMRSGIFSTAQALGQLCAYRVPGFEDDPVGLAGAVVEAGLLDRIAETQLGVWGPLSVRGQTFRGPLIVVRDGRVALSDAMEALVTREHERARGPRTARERYASRLGALGVGCPVALHSGARVSGITHVARAVVGLLPGAMTRIPENDNHPFLRAIRGERAMSSHPSPAPVPGTPAIG